MDGARWKWNINESQGHQSIRCIVCISIGMPMSTAMRMRMEVSVNVDFDADVYLCVSSTSAEWISSVQRHYASPGCKFNLAQRGLKCCKIFLSSPFSNASGDSGPKRICHWLHLLCFTCPLFMSFFNLLQLTFSMADGRQFPLPRKCHISHPHPHAHLHRHCHPCAQQVCSLCLAVSLV